MTVRGRLAGRLWQEAAQAVIGRPVIVVRAGPTLKAHDGEATIEDGQTVIRVRASLPPERWFDVFLHELGHVACGHLEALEVSDTAEYPAASVEIAPSMVEDRQFVEQQAWHYARILAAEINRRVGPDAPASARLRALINAHS